MGRIKSKLIKRTGKNLLTEEDKFSSDFDFVITSFNLSLHSPALWDLPNNAPSKLLINQFGLLVVGPLEKFGLDGFLSGFFIIIFID